MKEKLLERVKITLEKNTSETIIDLSDAGLMDEDVERVVELLKRFDKKIKRLNLYRNNIGDKGAKSLATLTNVQVMELNSNGIEDEGVKALISNNEIKELHLVDNAISNNCAPFIIENAKQHFLCLERNKIQRENLTRIEEITRANRENVKKSTVNTTKMRENTPPLSHFFEEGGSNSAVSEKEVKSVRSAKSFSEFIKAFVEKHPELPEHMEALREVVEEWPNISIASLMVHVKSLPTRKEGDEKTKPNISEFPRSTKLK